ncbi:MAG TPA: DUF5818 domain-containing protein [Candidatus Acidoferrum sp.]|nr:DUF5818 domain-containing protein [Candidatus Acidoferrum sp.]
MQKSLLVIAVLGCFLSVCPLLQVPVEGFAGTGKTSANTTSKATTPRPTAAQSFTGTIVSLNGELFILRDDANNTWYHLDDQKKAGKFVGKSVLITGTLNASLDVIHIDTIREAGH